MLLPPSFPHFHPPEPLPSPQQTRGRSRKLTSCPLLRATSTDRLSRTPAHSVLTAGASQGPSHLPGVVPRSRPRRGRARRARHRPPPGVSTPHAPRLVDMLEPPTPRATPPASAPGPRRARVPRAPPEPAPHGPPTAGRPALRHCPSAVTCCQGRLPPHTTPGSGDGGGWSRGSHMRPPGDPASRSRRRGPPRSARIRDAGPAAGANAAPPLRLWLPREFSSVPRSLRLCSAAEVLLRRPATNA
jgi:hypothetical protein